MAVFIHGTTDVTATRAAVDSSAIKPVTLIIKAPLANGATVYVGDSAVTTATGWPLEPGEEFRFDEAHGPLRRMPAISEVFVIGTPGSEVAWIATPR